MGKFQKYDQPCRYDILVRGSIDPKWTDWFDGLTILSLREAETMLTGLITDQSALHGLLAVIRNFRLTLLSLQRVEGTRITSAAFVKMKHSSTTKTPSIE